MWDKPPHLNLAAALLGVAAAGVLIAALLNWAARQPVFAIQRVMVTGQIIEVNPLHLEAVIREALRGTFFTIDLVEAQRAFSQVPWVRQAAVRREWPNRLVVDIDEHRALARWNEHDLVNTAGGVFRADYEDELPQLRGPEGSAAEVAARFAQFRELLAPLALVPVELALSPRRAWAMKLDNGMLLELGRGEASERLVRWAAYYPRSLARLGHRVEYVDLRYRNGFAVRVKGLWQEGARTAGGARRDKHFEGTG